MAPPEMRRRDPIAGKPTASFVIPVLNDERHIGRCLGSIRRLSVPVGTVEVMVVDNGSTDRTRQIVDELGFECLVAPGVHVGALRNRGAALARADLVAFVDSDVELAADWLQQAVSILDDRRVVAAGALPGVPEPATWVQEAWDAHQRGRRPVGRPSPVPWLPSMNLLVRRQDFMAAGGFDETLETAEDVDLCYRLGARGTIVCQPAMHAIHWGEAPDLVTFWRKERWRSLGNLRGVAVHGLRWDELPSLIYPLYMVGGVLLTVAGGVVDVHRGEFRLLPLSLMLLVAPAAGLAANTARMTRRPRLVAKLFVLYFTYGVARAWAVVTPRWRRDGRRR